MTNLILTILAIGAGALIGWLAYDNRRLRAEVADPATWAPAVARVRIELAQVALDRDRAVTDTRVLQAELADARRALTVQMMRGAGEPWPERTG